MYVDGSHVLKNNIKYRAWLIKQQVVAFRLWPPQRVILCTLNIWVMPYVIAHFIQYAFSYLANYFVSG